MILFEMILLKCKDNANEAINKTIEVINEIKRTTMEERLYAQVVKLFRKDLKYIAENKNKNEAKFKFQGQSARSRHWFDIDFDLIEVNFSTREPGFYKKPFQIHENTQDTNTFKSFQVPIGISKCAENVKFHKWCPNAQVLSELFE